MIRVLSKGVLLIVSFYWVGGMLSQRFAELSHHDDDINPQNDTRYAGDPGANTGSVGSSLGHHSLGWILLLLAMVAFLITCVHVGECNRVRRRG